MTSNHSKVRIHMLLFVAALSLTSHDLFAHARWVIGSVTPPRTNDTGLKSSPCGGAARTSVSTIFSANQTIDVEFEETVNHDGYFRIAFSPKDDLNFDSYVLQPNIQDITNTGKYTQQITIPNQICDACTLQLIQYMVTSTSTSYYYSCSDIQITNANDLTAPAVVSNLTAADSGSGQAILSWTNPAADFYRVVILKSSTAIFDEPVSIANYQAGDMINQSEVVYVGNASSLNVNSLIKDSTYYFKVFSQNPRKNYAAGVETSIMITSTSTSSGSGGSGDGGAGGADSGGGSTANTVSNESSGGGLSPYWLFFTFIFSILRRRT